MPGMSWAGRGSGTVQATEAVAQLVRKLGGDKIQELFKGQTLGQSEKLLDFILSVMETTEMFYAE